MRKKIAAILLAGSTIGGELPTLRAQGTDADTADARQEMIAMPPLRTFDEEARKAYLNDPALAYDRLTGRQEPWGERLREWWRRMLNDLFGSRGGRWMFDNLDWMLVVAAVLILLFQFRRRLFHGAFASPPAISSVVAVTEAEIGQLDLERLLREAEDRGDLRLALRFLHLMALRWLVDHRLITWRPDGTDRDYRSQLKDALLRERFIRLSRAFQACWYGGAPMTRERYATLRSAHAEFRSTLRHAG